MTCGSATCVAGVLVALVVLVDGALARAAPSPLRQGMTSAPFTAAIHNIATATATDRHVMTPLHHACQINLLDVPDVPNVFNTTLLDASASFTCSSLSDTVKTRGFYFQNYTRVLDPSGAEKNSPSGPPTLAFRFTPTTMCNYSYAITVAGSTVASGTVQVTPSSDPGFLIVGANKQHFGYRSNASAAALLVGENLGWTNSRGTFAFDTYFQNMSRVGANYVRVWLTDGWDDLFIETALGNYSLPNTYHIDEVLQHAQKNGIAVLMCIESFNFLCTQSDAPCNWNEFVYNSANGGPIADPSDFFTNQQAMDYFKMRLDYIVARYSAFPSVFGWEFFNEVDITTDWSPDEQKQWVSEMATYVHSIDPYQHPISTSFCCHDVPEVYSLSEVDFSMTHTYGRPTTDDMAYNVQYFTSLLAAEYGKPSYVAEFGESAKDAGKGDPHGIGLHNGMWASIVSLGAGSAMTWWWDSWVAKYELYQRFRSVRAFADRVPWMDHTWTAAGWISPPCKDVPPSTDYTCAQQKSWGKCNASFMKGFCCKTCFDCSADCVGSRTHGIAVAPFVRAYGALGQHRNDRVARDIGAVGNTTAVVWVQNTNNTYAKQNAQTPKQNSPLNRVNGAVVTLGPMIAAAEYTVHWMATNNASWIRDDSVTASNSPDATIHLAVPDFTTDMAAFVEPA